MAYKIIDFISQFEDELVRIWNKPKFVFNSNYVITLGRLLAVACHCEARSAEAISNSKGIELIQKIINHPNFAQQVAEWKQLGIVNDSFIPSAILNPSSAIPSPAPVIPSPSSVILSGSEESLTLNQKYTHLPIDTKYFKDLELTILGLFDDLDNTLDGWLIKSENYQALNTILPKFRERVQTIYIDPPFNKEQDADYFYSVKYKDSSWITILENRLWLAKDILKDSGAIFIRCDYNGNMFVRLLMNEIFGEENFRNELQISRISKQDPKAKKFNIATDSLFFYSKGGDYLFSLLFKKLLKAKGERWHAMDSQGQGQPLYIFGYLFEPPKRRHWTYGQENIKEMENEERIRIKCRKCSYIHTLGIWQGCPNCDNKDDVKIEYLLAPTTEKQIDSNWTDISGYTSNWDFPTENSEILLKRVIESTSNEGDLVMDYFLGSGTTTAVAHKLKRKWIGIEMGEHFYTAVLPRMKKVLAYDKWGISKEKDVKEAYNKKTAGGFFKYQVLEQYEDTLRKVKYEDSDLFDSISQDPYNQYVFMRDLKMLEALEIDYENNKVKVDLHKLYPSIDIPETLSNLLGKYIKKISPNEVEFENGEKIDLNNLDYKLIKSLIWW
jgi:adenine specific DNA methylase Mod